MLADCVDLASRDDVKTHFNTREGNYTLMPLSEYSRPNKNAFSQPSQQPVKISFSNSSGYIQNKPTQSHSEKICFNIGKEIYVHSYNSVRKAADLTRPIDKRSYKSLFPTCHDFNQVTATSDSALLLVGLSGGQVQLIDPIKKEANKIYNEERIIEESKVTCIRWHPGAQSSNRFIVAHSSGRMYVYEHDVVMPISSGSLLNQSSVSAASSSVSAASSTGSSSSSSAISTPHFQQVEAGPGYCIHKTIKIKNSRYPLFKWTIGQEGIDVPSINDIAFSPCNRYLAIASQDGFMRVFDFMAMTLEGFMRSYFGGFLCVCWSNDGRYIATGGEDDLLTIWSLEEKRVVCRGRGHMSWINVIAFDSFAIPSDSSNGNGGAGEPLSSRTQLPLALGGVRYRIGSGGQDCLFCIWEITEQDLDSPDTSDRLDRCNFVIQPQDLTCKRSSVVQLPVVTPTPSSSDTVADTSKLSASSSTDSRKQRTLNKRVAAAAAGYNGTANQDSSSRLLGTPSCPAFDKVPILEPIIRKKVANERLTGLAFREECIVIACQDGTVHTWARPGKVGLAQHKNHPYNHGMVSRSISPANILTSFL